MRATNEEGAGLSRSGEGRREAGCEITALMMRLFSSRAPQKVTGTQVSGEGGTWAAGRESWGMELGDGGEEAALKDICCPRSPSFSSDCVRWMLFPKPFGDFLLAPAVGRGNCGSESTWLPRRLFSLLKPLRNCEESTRGAASNYMAPEPFKANSIPLQGVSGAAGCITQEQKPQD